MPSWWQRRRKIVQMPGTKTSPEVALARTLEKARHGTIKSVYIGIEWKDDKTQESLGFEGEWSNMERGDLLCHAKVADAVATRVFFGEDPNMKGNDPVGAA